MVNFIRLKFDLSRTDANVKTLLDPKNIILVAILRKIDDVTRIQVYSRCGNPLLYFLDWKRNENVN